MVSLLKKDKKNINKQKVYSTKKTVVGLIAQKLGVNDKFHKFQDDYFEDNNNFIISPVDAKLVSSGPILNGGKIISKSNKEISLEEIIGKHASLFEGGFYLNFYLSPGNRHYWRMPYDSSLVSMNINQGKAKIPIFIGLDNIFKNKDYFRKAINKNANVGMVFNSKSFSFTMIPVGSLNVNGIHIIDENNSKYKKGDIGGYFSIGSSMLLCFPKNSFKILIKNGDNVKIGQNIIEIN